MASARVGLLLVAVSCVAAAPASADGGDCRLLRYTFEVAARAPGSIAGPPLDLPPQIAVWLEAPDGSFVDTLMVTSAVALRGIANRPGRWDLPSGPKFPYGRRPMALPVWAHARGQLYPAIRMEDGDEEDLMGHEGTSSPEPYFCRPMLATEVVDAVTCPSGLFRSAKGVFASDGSTSYYPPRGDLLDALGQPCPPLVNQPRGSCDVGDSPRYGILDDLDAVAAATPAPGAPYTGGWVVPSGLPAGDYALLVEVAKEFDENPTYTYATSEGAVDSMFDLQFGLRGNIGQPSVVYRVPITLAVGASAATTDAAGHGDPLGDEGTLFPPDGTLSTDPGTGEARLDVIGGPAGAGRVEVEVDACPTPSCEGVAPPAAVAVDAPPADVTATSATLEIRRESEGTEPVLGYDIRYQLLQTYLTADTTQIARWTPGPTVPPGAPGDISSVTLDDLVPASGYVVAVRAQGACGDSPPTLVRFFTPRIPYRKLSGCFIASAAFDDRTVDVLRRERDRAVQASGVVAAVADIYRRTAPPLARLLDESATARAVARELLGPAVAIARAAGD